MNDKRLGTETHFDFCLAELEQLVGARNVLDTLRVFVDGSNSLVQQLEPQVSEGTQPAPAVIRRGAHQMRSAAKQLKMGLLEQAAKAILQAKPEHAADKALVQAFHVALKMSIQEVERYLAERAAAGKFNSEEIN